MDAPTFDRRCGGFATLVGYLVVFAVVAVLAGFRTLWAYFRVDVPAENT